MFKRYGQKVSVLEKIAGVVALLILAFLLSDLITRPKPLTDEQRLEAGRTMLANATAVAKESGDKEAQEIAAFLTRTVIFCKPEGNGGKMLEDGHPTDDWVAFFPISEPDYRVGDTWNILGQLSVVGAYLPGMSSIAIKVRPKYSPKVEAMSVLHEGHHALGHRKMIELGKYPSDPLEPEVGAYDLMRRILRKLGGDTYRQILAEQTRYAVDTIMQGGAIQPNGVTVKVPRYHPEFDTFLGPPESVSERETRELWLLLDSLLTIAELEQDPHKQKEMKIAFIRNMTHESQIPREWTDPPSH